jgi:putative endonuclease
MAMRNLDLGNWGEGFAARLLQKKGYRILQRNWRSAAGEVDLVAVNSQTLVLCEVKTRSTGEFGHPSEAVSHVRIERLQRAAEIVSNPHKLSVRIDVISIQLQPVFKFEHFEGIAR